MEGVSNTEIKLSVEIQYLSGTLAVNIPSPPSDRVWIGFRGNPDLQLSAHPAFGERSINFMHVTKWIEKKLAVEFQVCFVPSSSCSLCVSLVFQVSTNLYFSIEIFRIAQYGRFHSPDTDSKTSRIIDR